MRCRRHQHAKLNLRTRCLLNLGCYVAGFLSQQCFPFRFKLPAVKSTGGIDYVEQPISMFEFIAKLLIAFMEIKGVPILALPEQVETELWKLRWGKDYHTGVQGAYAWSEVTRDFAIVCPMAQMASNDHGVDKQQSRDRRCDCRVLAVAQQQQFRRRRGQV